MTRYEPRGLEEWRLFDVIGRSKAGREYFSRVLTTARKGVLSATGEDLVREQGQFIFANAMLDAMNRAPDEVRKLEERR